MSPTRIQRRRTAGWRMPEGAVYVGRPSKWGNPLTVADYRIAETALGQPRAPIDPVRADLADMFAHVLRYGPDSGYWSPTVAPAFIGIRAGLDAGELAGRTLACWCPLDAPCHGDVLLAVAAGEAP